MDSLDDAQAVTETLLNAAINNARSKGRALLPKGKCYFCDELLRPQALFCDIDCSEDYEKLQRKLRNMPE